MVGVCAAERYRTATISERCLGAYPSGADSQAPPPRQSCGGRAARSSPLIKGINKWLRPRAVPRSGRPGATRARPLPAASGTPALPGALALAPSDSSLCPEPWPLSTRVEGERRAGGAKAARSGAWAVCACACALQVLGWGPGAPLAWPLAIH